MQKTRNQLETQIETLLADNTSQAISAQDIRDVLKDNMTSSMYAPVMIYAGILKEQTTSTRYIKELYYNPDFFAKQVANDPRDSTNIYRLTSDTLVALPNGTYSNQSVTGTNGSGLKMDVVVSGGVMTSMTVAEPGSGYQVGDTLTMAIDGTITKNITYQGAIRFAFNSFTLTTNSDLGILENHTVNNTIISGTVKNIFVNDQEVYKSRIFMTGNNNLRADVEATNDPAEGDLHIQLWRVAGI